MMDRKMSISSGWARALVLVLLAMAIPAAAGETPPRVELARTPAGGIQPQAVMDASGTLHLVYFRGEPAGGDIYYTHRGSGETEFAPALRVNHAPGSAVAIGTMRGAQIALGRNGRVHVAWNGSMSARPANPNGGVPMLYARSNENRTVFEQERDLMTRSSVLDGGGTLAADARGRVLVAWHALPLNSPRGETNRRMFVARSDDDGATFASEEPAITGNTGACGCCGTRALATSSGSVFMLYRAATGGSDRDITLLTSRDRGTHFDARKLHRWTLNTCPMSSSSIAEGAAGQSVVAAWETQGQIFLARIDPEDGTLSTPFHPRGVGGNRKHPAIAVNARGEILVSWAEDTSFQRGGSLAWRILDASGKSTEESGRIDRGIPASSLPTVVARPDGGFTIIH